MITTTTAIITTEEQATEFLAGVQARAAEKRAAKAVKAERQAALNARREKKIAEVEAAAMAQYHRDVAANPNTIIYNPTTKNYDAYRDGACVAQAGSYLAAEAARLALVTRDLNAPAGDVVVTAVVEDVVVHELVYAPAEEASVSDFRNTLIGRLARAVASTETTVAGAEIGAWVAPVADAADAAEVASDVFDAEAHAMKPETYEREVVTVEQAGTGEFGAPIGRRPWSDDEWVLVEAWQQAVRDHGYDSIAQAEAMGVLEDYWREHGIARCANQGDCVYGGMALECAYCRTLYPDGILSPEEMDTHSDALPRPLPVCPCGTTYTTHAIPGCECAAATAAVSGQTGSGLGCRDCGEVPTAVYCDACGMDVCRNCYDRRGGFCGCYVGVPMPCDCGGQGCRDCAPPPAPSASEPATYEQRCDDCGQIGDCVCAVDTSEPANGEDWWEDFGLDGFEPLPFTPGPADAADALAEIEAAAGVVDVEPPPSELALQFAETARRLVEWQDAVANGGDWVAARRAHIDAMLEVERFAGLKAWPAVAGQAA